MMLWPILRKLPVLRIELLELEVESREEVGVSLEVERREEVGVKRVEVEVEEGVRTHWELRRLPEAEDTDVLRGKCVMPCVWCLWCCRRWCW